ncbi:SagB family peptide dehydrogenase [Frankia sp. AgPm24]|uniref:SagB family peptide dehydrogenase n=1 Tax=Frankia sp. AgPm24 TaxID=631128 RepID=UPI00200D4A9A|nr:SagB family peptide dehydrogenase [Frankia sp. AgPm24]MCK9921756.1 SagB family peptide dehydrogenase [Frankia sp. AgPm24]
MSAADAAADRIAQVRRLLDGAPGHPVVLDGLSATAGRIALPAPVAALPDELGAVLDARRSWYRFGAGMPSAAQVSSLLHWSWGPQRQVRLPDGSAHRMRMAPSAGGLRSLAVYVLAKSGGELPGGVFEYDADGHALETLWSGEPAAALRSVLVQPEFARRAAMAVVLVGRLDTTLVRYPARHYRTVHVDAGIALQNLYLTATTLGLAGCAVTAFDDHAVARLLRLPDDRFPIVVFPLGRRP